MQNALYSVSDGEAADITAILGLLQRLADFSIPARRRPEELWEGDAELLKRWADGALPEAVVKVARDSQGSLLGVAFAQLRNEALSQTPGAHLEVLALAKSAEGQGVARALMESVESAVSARGALSMTLNVFTSNSRARGLYSHLGYDEELLRCIKSL